MKKIIRKKHKTVYCNCGQIIRFWNQKCPDNPHNFPNLTCPKAKKENSEAMKRAQEEYYLKRHEEGKSI